MPAEKHSKSASKGLEIENFHSFVAPLTIAETLLEMCNL
jgi:hypothetical protein